MKIIEDQLRENIIKSQELMEQYRISQDIFNVILHYAIIRKDKRIPIDKFLPFAAATFWRKKIKTVGAAIAYFEEREQFYFFEK